MTVSPEHDNVITVRSLDVSADWLASKLKRLLFSPTAEYCVTIVHTPDGVEPHPCLMLADGSIVADLN